jgi:hypothetical protein
MATASAWELRLTEDNLVPGEALSLEVPGINRAIYVVHGAVTVNGKEYADDTAWHGRQTARLAAGPAGAVLWRWELAPILDEPVRYGAQDAPSQLKLRRPLPWPIADSLLMRCDSVSFPPGGCAYLHTHQGPGIRCLIEGGIRIDTGGKTHSYAPGNAWFEAGPEPVFAQAAADRPTRFIRVMVLPARLEGQSSIAYVNAEDREKPKSQRYRVYFDEPIDL